RPESFHPDPTPATLADRRVQVVLRRSLGRKERVGGQGTADLAHLLGEDGAVLQPVAVSVDDGVAQLGTHLGGGLMAVATHWAPPRRKARNVGRRFVAWKLFPRRIRVKLVGPSVRWIRQAATPSSARS